MINFWLRLCSKILQHLGPVSQKNCKLCFHINSTLSAHFLGENIIHNSFVKQALAYLAIILLVILLTVELYC